MLLIKFNLVVKFNVKETFLSIKTIIGQIIDNMISLKDKTFVKCLNFCRKKQLLPELKEKQMAAYLFSLAWLCYIDNSKLNINSKLSKRRSSTPFYFIIL